MSNREFAMRQFAIRAGSSNAQEDGQFIIVEAVFEHELYRQYYDENDISID